MAEKSIHSAEYKAVIKFLIESRKSQGKTQQDVADKLGKPQSYVAKYEKCERRLDVLELKEICKVLAIDVKKVFENL